jgi:hypothetical protein
MIPSKADRKQQLTIDGHLYKESHLIGKLISKLKHRSLVFLHFEKLAENYWSFVYFPTFLTVSGSYVKRI